MDERTNADKAPMEDFQLQFLDEHVNKEGEDRKKAVDYNVWLAIISAATKNKPGEKN